ncbi:unnamed protein product [Closterium sp. NIES-53]
MASSQHGSVERGAGSAPGGTPGSPPRPMQGRVGDGPAGASACFVGGFLSLVAPTSRHSFRYSGPRPPPSGQTQPESGSWEEDEEEEGEGEEDEDDEGSGDDSEAGWDPETHGDGKGGDDEEDHEMDGLEPEEVEEGVGEGGEGAATEAASQHVAEGGGSMGVKKNFIPSRWMVSRDTVVYATAALQSAIAEMLAKEGELGCKVSITIDMWTAPNNKAWLVVTGHWIGEKFQLRTMVLEFHEMLGRHGGREMAQVVEETVVQWGLEGRCLGFTTDNASSNIAAFRWMSEEGGGQCFFSSRMHFRCLAHAINLAVQAALAVDSIRKLLKIPREMASWIGFSPQRSGSFLGLQRTLNSQANPATPKSALKLVQDSPTRWGSTHDMVERAAVLQDAGTGGMMQDDEVSRYLSERVQCDVTSLEYWRSATNMQTMRRMARDDLAIPATSASSERVFSLGCNLISWKRHRLASQRTRAVMILRSWYRSHPGQRIGEGHRPRGAAPPEFVIEGEGAEEEEEGVEADDTAGGEDAVVGSNSAVAP